MRHYSLAICGERTSLAEVHTANASRKISNASRVRDGPNDQSSIYTTRAHTLHSRPIGAPRKRTNTGNRVLMHSKQIRALSTCSTSTRRTASQRNRKTTRAARIGVFEPRESLVVQSPWTAGAASARARGGRCEHSTRRRGGSVVQGGDLLPSALGLGTCEEERLAVVTGRENTFLRGPREGDKGQ